MVAGMASSYEAKPFPVVRAGHAREKRRNRSKCGYPRLKPISEGETDIREGRMKSQEDVFTEIEQELKAKHK
jgi:hypothetical protein